MLFIDSSEAVVYGGNQNAAQSTAPVESTVPVEGNYASNNTGIVNPQDENTVTSSQQNTQSVGNKEASTVLYDQTKGGYLPKYAVLDDKIEHRDFTLTSL